MGNLFTLKGGKMLSVFTKIGERLPAELGEQIDLNPDLADIMVNALRDHLKLAEKNPFEMSVEDQIAALREANHAEGWDINDEMFTRLVETAPEWPAGKLAVRSFRIRFGAGDKGVAKTFEAHATRIEHVFGEQFYWRWSELKSGKDHLRLLNGNQGHRPAVEWIVIDLDVHRKRKSIMDARGPRSLADELLVIAWMFPDLIRAIDYDNHIPGLFAAGYELSVPGHSEWTHVVCVHFSRDRPQMQLHASHRRDCHSSRSVPVLRE